MKGRACSRLAGLRIRLARRPAKPCFLRRWRAERVSTRSDKDATYAGQRASRLLGLAVSTSFAFGLACQGDSLKSGSARIDAESVLATSRMTEARFAGQEWRPFPTPPRSSVAEMRAWSGRLARAGSAGPRPLRAQAALALAEDNFDSAVTLLRASLYESETEAKQSDLAAALYARAQGTKNPSDLMAALEALDQEDSAEPARRFNRALLLEALGLPIASRKAWSQAIASETDTSWRKEEEERLRQSASGATSSCSERLKIALGSVEDRVNALELGDLASNCPAEAHDFALYDLLGDWGNEPSGERGTRRYGAAQAIAQSLLEKGEEQLSKTIQRIELSSGQARERIARGHAALGDGRQFFLALEIEESVAPLRVASSELELGASPAADWARYWLAATNVYAGRFDNLRRELDQLELRAGPTLGTRLRAWIELSRGTAALREHDFDSAIEHYQSAATGFISVGDLERAGAAETSLGDTFEALGRTEEEWQVRASAQRHLAERLESGWRATTLSSWALSALRSGLTNVARAMAIENLEGLGAGANPVDLIEAELLVGRLAHLNRDKASSRRALAHAEALIDTLKDDLIKRNLSSDLALARAEADDYQSPEEAVKALSREVIANRDNERRLYRAATFLELGRAYVRLGDVSRGLGALQEAAQEHEQTLAALGDPLAASPFAEIGQRIYDSLISAYADQGDLVAAAATAERARALPSRRQEISRGRSSLNQIRATLEPGELLLAYTLAGRRPILAALERDRESFYRLDVESSEIDMRSRRWMARLASGAPEPELTEDATWLSRALLPPIATRLAQARRLLVTPDAALALIPFSALPSPTTDQPLIRTIPVATLPSGLMLAHARKQALQSKNSAPWLVSVVGADSTGFSDTNAPLLGEVRGEATSIAALWPETRLALGSEASPEAWANALETSSVVHFAGHARAVPGAPGRAALWLWDTKLNEDRAFPAPAISHGPWPNLTLVVLAGCETALPAPRRYLANDGVAALFLAHGVPAVVATRWPIPDRQARQLFVAFHRGLAAGADAAIALQEAQLELLNSGDSSLNKPAVWAAAQLVGAPVVRPQQHGRE